MVEGDKTRWIIWKIVVPLWKATLGRFIFVKYSPHGEVEAATMRFIRERTTIPVPRVWGVLTFQGLPYIFMSRLPGRDLWNPDIWQSLPESVNERILSQLRDYVGQLRELEPPSEPPLICSVLGGPVLDHRLSTTGPYGPYRDEAQFNSQRRQGYTVEQYAAYRNFPSEILSAVRRAHTIRHSIVFTHNDLHPGNILVEGDRVTGIVDWECAGWFPAHWEYVKALFLIHDPKDPWLKDVPKFIPAFEFEADVDINYIGWSRDWMGVVLEPDFNENVGFPVAESLI
ncbi:hypothetical protein NLJ89_g8911 [Agrocybe chaxingu]|uniref:Aminoglycoside phosphotransferase domain-containing protein n=1 Tax=Agrocybe chaxingu TaxID=84603 RepID=A0A9W8JWQ5_9AGAR|nr:hypothetical protein NLJ89_g8911 [Agrocybe chaxingu]